MPKLSPEALRLVRDAAEAERAVGSAKLATALEMLVEWHERQVATTTVTAKLSADVTAPRAAVDVLAERRRQVAEYGFDAAHDDKWRGGQLEKAAGCYAKHAAATERGRDAYKAAPPLDWPWDRVWWGPTTRRRDLVKAGALILAAIEKIDRAAADPTTPETGG